MNYVENNLFAGAVGIFALAVIGGACIVSLYHARQDQQKAALMCRMNGGIPTMAWDDSRVECAAKQKP